MPPQTSPESESELPTTGKCMIVTSGGGQFASELSPAAAVEAVQEALEGDHVLLNGTQVIFPRHVVGIRWGD